jgi:hypothetical protein
MIKRTGVIAVLCVGLLGLLPVGVSSAESAPEVSHDGLHLLKGAKVSLAYVKPGEDFSQYSRLIVLDCLVAFKKDWKSRNSKVTGNDMARIKKDLAAEFHKVFVEELGKDGGYPIVDQADSDVLILRPAIIDLDVAAPDRMSAGRSNSFTTSAGEMTLLLELHDSVSGEILARVLDRQGGRKLGNIQWTNRSTNVAAARSTLRGWARLLREKLDEVRGKKD